jgi:UDP-N-acetylmuramoylalanine--D-glutamate ligase
MKQNWQGQRVLVIGAARQGLALARYLSSKGAAVILNDQSHPDKLAVARESLAGLPVEWVLGSHPLELLDRVDLVCVSGGVPLSLPIVAEALRRGLPLTNDSQIFMEAVPCPVTAITGSAGKTTTTTLVGRMAQAAVQSPRRAWVGGNIGTPLIDLVDEISQDDLVVLELSSFQLELMTHSPQVGAVLNITPNHLDRHGTMQAYTAAKLHILSHQTPSDTAILGREDPGAWGLRDQVRGKLLSFGWQRPELGQAGTFRGSDTLYATDGSSAQKLLSVESVRLRGDHNLLNVLAACAVALASGLPVEALQAGVEGFGGVPHRQELVREWRGSRWYNDSIATAPERTMAAIRSYSEPLVLLLGGRDKNLPWENLAELVRRRVDHLVVFGEAAEKIVMAVGTIHTGERPYSIEVCAGTQAAVEAAARVARPGDVVLFSPGGTSYDEFKDFEERGECFRRWVQQLL